MLSVTLMLAFKSAEEKTEASAQCCKRIRAFNQMLSVDINAFEKIEHKLFKQVYDLRTDIENSKEA
jgi:hypothetical protein